MSAYICSDKHLQTIVNHVAVNVLDKAFYSGREYSNDRLLTALYNENVKSVNHRYTGDKEPEILNMVFQPGKAKTVTAVQFLKLLQSYVYQASEHPEWKESLIRRLVNRWQEQAIRNLSGYDEAEWSI